MRHGLLKDVTQARLDGKTPHSRSSGLEAKTRQRGQGRKFWQDESYDHWARDEEADVYASAEYIEKRHPRWVYLEQTTNCSYPTRTLRAASSLHTTLISSPSGAGGLQA